MRLHHLIVAAAALSLSLPVAYADTFTFANTVLSDGATITGTVTIDTVNGLFGTLHAVVKDGTATYTFNSPSTGLGGGGANFVFTNYYDGLGNFIDFELVTRTLVGYSGGNICTFALCGGSGYLSIAGGGTPPVFSNGALIATTPEPSTIVLLFSGLLGLLGIATWKQKRTNSDASTVTL